MKVIVVCPICECVRRIKNERDDAPGFKVVKRVKSGAKISHISPRKCKNKICQEFQRGRHERDLLLSVQYTAWKKKEDKKEDSKLKFLQVKGEK